jgi:hypothetical protein
MRSVRISSTVAKELGHYVYLYVNPLDNTVFYVGKGVGGRALAHLKTSQDRSVAKEIEEIRATGAEPRVEILAHALPNAATALRVEAAAIDLLGLGNLTNAVRGHGAKYGRMPVDEVVAHYTRRPVKIREPSILIRINREYRYGMSEVELYDATRSAWKLGKRREQAELAFAVFEGVVREVYQISQWLPGGSTFNVRRSGAREPIPSRWEFVGTLANEKVRLKYRNRYVGDYFTQGAQNPISYVNID